MKPIVASLLATALSAAIGSAYAQTDATKTDTAMYRTVTQKAAADYKSASNLCKNQPVAARNVCIEEAKVTRARAELAAITDHNNTLAGRTKARTALVNADYALAKAKCAGAAGAEKDSCVNNARSVQTAALANAKADRDITVAANVDSTGAITNTTPADPGLVSVRSSLRHGGEIPPALRVVSVIRRHSILFFLGAEVRQEAGPRLDPLHQCAVGSRLRVDGDARGSLVE